MLDILPAWHQLLGHYRRVEDYCSMTNFSRLSQMLEQINARIEGENVLYKWSLRQVGQACIVMQLSVAFEVTVACTCCAQQCTRSLRDESEVTLLSDENAIASAGDCDWIVYPELADLRQLVEDQCILIMPYEKQVVCTSCEGSGSYDETKKVQPFKNLAQLIAQAD